MPFSKFTTELLRTARSSGGIKSTIPKAQQVQPHEFDSEALKATASAMYDFLLPHAFSVGIAGVIAPWFNVDRSILGLFNTKDGKMIGKEPFLILVNPQITAESEETELRIEHSLNTPGTICWIKRPIGIMLEACTIDGARKMGWIEGEQSWRIQQLVDALNGIELTAKAEKTLIAPTHEQVSAYSKQANSLQAYAPKLR